MEIIPGFDAFPDARVKRPVVTWGVFDGVHVGHRRVISEVFSWARQLGVSSLVATFDRHPGEILYGRDVPLVTSLEDRLRLIGELGIDFCVLIRFTREFARTTASEFIRSIIANRIGASAVVLGHDSHFGRDRKGDVAMLERLAREVTLAVRFCPPVMIDGRPMSSSLIREAIFSGRLEEAGTLLGRPPSVIGTVVKGNRRGTQLGFPTANLDLHHKVRPPAGVYAGEAVLNGRTYPAAINVGSRPTFEPEGAPEHVEVHLLGYSGGDLYGCNMEVRFHGKIREEMKFSGVDELRRQIEADLTVVKGRIG